MRGLRLSEASWQMLQRLEQGTAALVFNREDGRFCFVLHGQLVDLVRPSTVDMLTRAGLIQRERSATPCYTISDRGRLALRKRIRVADLADENWREAARTSKVGVILCDSPHIT